MLHTRVHAIEGRGRCTAKLPAGTSWARMILVACRRRDDVLLDPHPRRGPEEHEQGDARHQGRTMGGR